MSESKEDTQAIYLDYNATSLIKPEVVKAMTSLLSLAGNPSSVHQFGRSARDIIESSRDRVANMIGARSEEIIFTGGGTESNNMALFGSGRKRIVLSVIEHPSVLEAAKALLDNEVLVDKSIELVPVDENGVVDPSSVAKAIGRDGENVLVSIMLANNETGVIQPIPEIAAVAKEQGALMHCDAVQAPGRIPFDVNTLGIDLLSISAHKFGGPKGVGALFISNNLRLKPLVIGGGQERGLRPGTENVIGIAGFGIAADLVSQDLQNMDHIEELRNSLEKELCSLEPRVRIFSQVANRLPNTSCLSMPGVQSEMQVMGLDLAGVAVSAGSACSSGKVEPSHVLTALGLPPEDTGCAIRVSFGWGSKKSDVEKFVSVWQAFYAGLSSRYNN